MIGNINYNFFCSFLFGSLSPSLNVKEGGICGTISLATWGGTDNKNLSAFINGHLTLGSIITSENPIEKKLYVFLLRTSR